MINKWLFLFFFVSALAVLQAGLRQISWLTGFNIIVVFAIVTVLRADYKETAFIVALSGLILDFYSGLPDGILTLSLIITAYLVFILSRSLLEPYSGLAVLFALTIAGILCFNLLVWLLSWMISSYSFAVVAKILAEIITTIVLVPAAVWFFELKNKIWTHFAN